jgi:hypothetical protein
METAIRNVADNTIGYTQKQARNEWLDEESEMINEEKHALRARVIHKNIRAKNIEYKQAR